MDYVAQVGVFFLLYTILASSLNVISGYGGMFTVAQGAHFGIGAYTYAICASKVGMPISASIIVALVVSSTLVALLSTPASRLRGDYLVVATLALQIVLETIFSNLDAVTNGQQGITGIPFYDVAVGSLGWNGSYLVLSAVVAVVAVGLVAYCVRSPWGRVLRAIREDEIAAASLGKHVSGTKTVAFAFAGFLAAVSGIIYAAFVSFIDPASFTIVVSINILAMVLIGGSGNKFGPLIGAAIIVGLPEVLRPLDFPSNVDAQLDLIIDGVLLVLFMVLRPQGILPERNRTPRPMRAVAATGPAAPGARPASTMRLLHDREEGTLVSRDRQQSLSVEEVHRHFGSKEVVRGVSLDAAGGEVLGIVGPNGAGKTVLLDVISGFLQPTRGRITLHGRNLRRARPEQVARMGMVRLFQEQRVFAKLSVIDNVVLGFGGQARESAWRMFDLRPRVRAREADVARRAHGLLDLVGLSGHAGELAGSLSGGQQRLVSIARALAATPRVLLLDEPCAGVAPGLVETLRETVRDIASGGTTVIVVEHNVQFIRDVADRVAFMAEGRILRLGTPDQVLADDELSRVYFGVQNPSDTSPEAPADDVRHESFADRTQP